MLWANHLTCSLVKHLNICSSGGFEWSYALSKSSYLLCGENIQTSNNMDLSKSSYWFFDETSRHLFICRFKTVICYEQNILLALWWKHLNICSSGGFERSCALTKHLNSYLICVKTSKHLIILILCETSKHLFIWRFWTLICFDQTSYLICGENIQRSDHLDL